MLRSPPGTHGVWKKSLSGHVERQTNNKNAHIIVLLSTRAPAFISGPIRSVAGQRVGLLYKRQIKTLKSLFNPILWKFLRYKQRVPLYLWAGANEYGFFFFSLLPRRKHSALMNGNRVLAQLRRFGTKLTLKMVCSAKMQREERRKQIFEFAGPNRNRFAPIFTFLCYFSADCAVSACLSLQKTIFSIEKKFFDENKSDG